MTKLSDLVKLISLRDGGYTWCCANADFFFKEISKLGITEVEVNEDEMLSIIQVYLSLVGGDKNGNQGQVVKEGKLDKFLGVKLNYDH